MDITPNALNERVYRICQNNFIASTSFVQHCGLCLGSDNAVNISIAHLCLFLYYDKVIVIDRFAYIKDESTTNKCSDILFWDMMCIRSVIKTFIFRCPYQSDMRITSSPCHCELRHSSPEDFTRYTRFHKTLIYETYKQHYAMPTSELSPLFKVLLSVI